MRPGQTGIGDLKVSIYCHHDQILFCISMVPSKYHGGQSLCSCAQNRNATSSNSIQKASLNQMPILFTEIPPSGPFLNEVYDIPQYIKMVSDTRLKEVNIMMSLLSN